MSEANKRYRAANLEKIKDQTFLRKYGFPRSVQKALIENRGTNAHRVAIGSQKPETERCVLTIAIRLDTFGEFSVLVATRPRDILEQ